MFQRLVRPTPPSCACAIALILICSLLSTSSARSAPITPGQTLGVDANEFAIPAGSVVAENTRTFQLIYTPPAGKEFSPSDNGGPFSGTLHNRVIRDPATSRLSFVYEVTAFRAGTVPLGNETTKMTLENFSNFSTDVAAALGSESSPGVTRSGDGSSLTFFNGDPGLGGVPSVVVKTDATNFNTQGRLRLETGDEFLLIDPENPDAGATATFLATNATFEGVYQPSVAGVAIPLPVGAAGGLVGLALALALERGRSSHWAARGNRITTG